MDDDVVGSVPGQVGIRGDHGREGLTDVAHSIEGEAVEGDRPESRHLPVRLRVAREARSVEDQ